MQQILKAKFTDTCIVQRNSSSEVSFGRGMLSQVIACQQEISPTVLCNENR